VTPERSSTPPLSPARRLLETATRLFYAEGIHAVGIDRIITEADVAKATFYKHFPSKDDLVVAYLEEQDRAGREAVAALPRKPPVEMIGAILSRVGTAAVAEGYRGCPFLNAAAEYPDRSSPVRQVIDRRRAWYLQTYETLLREIGVSAPTSTAELLVALSDGLLETAYLDNPMKVPALVKRAVAGLVVPRRKRANS
jgi:AcrR family transcriptional regulator